MQRDWSRPLLQWAGGGAAFLIVTLVWTWPLVPHLQDAFPPDLGDSPLESR
jgi:hypothetical protein